MFKKLNLFSKTEMKTLIFISEKDGELYERQISKGAGISAGSANTLLKSFARMGLLKRSKRGRMLFYRRNDSNPLLRQFKVFISINRLMPILQKISPLCRRVILFGSCKDGTNGEKSDVDLFVLTGEKEEVNKLLATHRKIQAIIMNAVEYSKLRENDKPLYERINAGIELYGDEDG